MSQAARLVHGVGAAALGAELAAAWLLAIALSGLLAAAPRAIASGLVVLCLVLWLPALAAGVLLGPQAGTAGLVIAMLPVLVRGWRALPAGQWRTARALDASRMRVVRVLVGPALAPFLCAALLLGMVVLGMRWRLETHPAPLILPDPVTATG